MHKVYLADRADGFSVEPGETLLAAAQRHGLHLPFGCRAGTCGACRVQVLEGRVHTRGEPPALSARERSAGYTLACLAEPDSDLRLELQLPEAFTRQRPQIWPARVVHRCWLAHDVVGLTLRPARGAQPLQWLPGQYLDVLTEDGSRRSFSIANMPGSDQIELQLRVVPNGRFVQWVAHDMPPRQILRFEAPLGAFFIREDSARPLLFMAGGTGLAPIRAMLQDRIARGERRPMKLFWGVRAQRDLYAGEELRRFAEQAVDFEYVSVLSAPDEGWSGARGWVHEELLRRVPELARHEVYMSGPPPMIEAGKAAFGAAGLPPAQLHYDSFEYAYRTFAGS